MNKVSVLLISCVAIVAGAWLTRELVFAQAPAASAASAAKEDSKTMTIKEWETLVQKRVAQVMGQPLTDADIRNPAYWHTAVYNKVEYTVYTGPGQAMIIRSTEQAKPRTGPARTTPATPKPATGDSSIPKPFETRTPSTPQ
jgi:hypothetical protein